VTFDQQEFEVRCEWGEHGVSELASISDVIIIVDVLSFSTCVDIAVSRGVLVYPFAQRGEQAQAFADSVGGVLAEPRRTHKSPSLSPTSLLEIAWGTRLVLPSPNGATLSLAAKQTPVLCGCLRNAAATAAAASKYGRKIGVIPAGERWKDNGSLRPCLEDLVGAGAIISQLNGSRSPEAQMALAVFREAESTLESVLRACSSGKELIELGFENDVSLAAQHNVSHGAPVLFGYAYTYDERIYSH
jgi:2-phosphosulfolactate phosphatase